MKSKIIFQLGVLMLTTLLFTSCRKEHKHYCDGDDTITTTTKVFATGFNNPRGLKFGPDGYLYVAEGGIGGKNASTDCEQVPPPVGPYTGDVTGSRISRVDHQGNRTTWVDNLPSSMDVMGDIVGVGDVAFIDNTLYAVITGAGCSHGVPTIPNSVIKINPNKSWTPVANLSEYLKSHPVANPEEDDFEPDGDWYSMTNVGTDLYAIEANHGELDKISTNGTITRVIDISATYGHIVPTVHAFRKGNFYVGNLNVFPAPPTGSSIYKITPEGQISEYATGFSMILGIAFDKLGGLYVLETTTNNPFPTPGTGDIVRIDPSGNRQVITTGLTFPTGMTLGNDGKIYVSNRGFGFPPGEGQVLQISFKCEEMSANIKN
ncbi:MAG: ScyD/ScyE family protein [Bacteroidota bacterium]|nr:ScyD/ScyE family protein [Bacteroidota bacterium]